MEELMKIPAKITSGLVEWAPSQIEALVTMQEAEFAIVIPMAGWLSIALLAVLVLTGLAHRFLSRDRDSNFAIWSIPIYTIAGLGLLIAGAVWITATVGYHVFRAAPELYVLKGLLAK